MMTEQTTRVYYTAQRRLIGPPGKYQWSNEGPCHTRGVNIMAHWDESQLEKLKELVRLSNEESELSEYRLVKVTEVTEIEYVPEKITQVGLW